jgi:hypothetical protein
LLLIELSLYGLGLRPTTPLRTPSRLHHIRGDLFSRKVQHRYTV